MSSISKFSEKSEALPKGTHLNHMDGLSYDINPIQTLKIVLASSIFGEPKYYEKGISGHSNITKALESLQNFLGVEIDMSLIKSKTHLTEKVIDDALDFDFKRTLEIAVELRNEYFMRLNPSVILMKAIMHPKREAFTKENPGFLKDISKKICLIPSDVTNQFDFWMYKKGNKNSLPSIAKRLWASTLESFDRYRINKYKGKSLIDIIRICHANNSIINELMTTGTLKVDDSEKTWEMLRSEKLSWKQILKLTHVPHMALLRNLRNIFSEEITYEESEVILEQLKKGVTSGKQFPFRYYSAYREIEKDSNISYIAYKAEILDALESCIDIAMSNVKKLKGFTVCLSDNSGSAHGALTSEYGSVRVSDIDNLSSVMTIMNSEAGKVYVFGDSLIEVPILRRNGILKNHQEVNKSGQKVGQSTEHGVYEFFVKAIKEGLHVDNLFIYSDMQAGHGELYGYGNLRSDFLINGRRAHFDCVKMVEAYRKEVNPKLNVFMVQTAGYKDSLIPESFRRGAILTGWTGKEVNYAHEIISIWNEIESDGE